MDYAFFSCESKGNEDLHEFMKSIKSKGPSIVIVTRGEKGSIAYDGNKFTEFGIVECEVIDSMGAGDSYIAGFLMGILEGKSIVECMKKGAQSSSETIGIMALGKRKENFIRIFNKM